MLDYGCGQGELVAELRAHGVDCYGTEVFYGGGAYDSPQLAALMGQGFIRHCHYTLIARDADYCRFRDQGRRVRALLDHHDRLQRRLVRRLGFMALEMRR